MEIFAGLRSRWFLATVGTGLDVITDDKAPGQFDGLSGFSARVEARAGLNHRAAISINS
jgi:hypothetical protein